MLLTSVSPAKIRSSKTLNRINWIDTPGGPRITVGKPIIVQGEKIGKVKYIDRFQDVAYIITFEDDILCNNTTKNLH